ncbi:retrovirus-related pol polyprotein from transposon TNT 1-94 [Tanacetum coccineum]
MSRTMLNEQSLPQKFWCNSVDTSTYILNRILIRAILGKTPYEILRGRKPTLDYFRVFGSKCFILNTKDYLTKFNPKSYEESLNVIFDETPPPSKTSPLVDDDLDEEEAIRATEKKNLENVVENETLEIDEIVNIKEYSNHHLENVIGSLNQRTLRSQAQNQKPKNVNEALGDKSWIVAMQEELNQFIDNDVWELVPQPKNMTIIGTKWVFRNKLDENGVVSRNKARLVAQSYNQQEGVDYDETYAPVARLESIRILLAYACALDFKLFQMDVKSAFLNDFINEKVYVAQPPGFIDFEKPDHVYILKKALYGLKQAPKAWYDRLKFEMSMMDELNFFFGLQIKQMEDGIFFNQSKYIKEMLKKFGLEDSKRMKTPMSSVTKLTKNEECESVDSTKYRGMIDRWRLDELAYGVPSDGPYQTNPDSIEDIISSIRIDREGQVRRIRHEEEIDVLEYQVTKQARLLLPYGMLLTRLFTFIMNENTELNNESYVLYDHVMTPLAAQLEQKPRRDCGMRRGRHSTSSSSAFDQSSSSHLNDDDDYENDEGTSRASTPSLIRYVNSLTDQVPQVFQNPPDIDPHLEPFYTRQTKIINCQVQLRDEQRGGVRSIGKSLRKLWRNMKK